MSETIRSISASLFIFLICVLLPGCEENSDFSGYYYGPDPQLPDSILNPESTYIAVIGDIQEYTPNEHIASYLYLTCDWLRSMQHYNGNISAVLQNGDLTWNNSSKPWLIADNALNYLGNDLMFIPVTGNHDYRWEGEDKFQITTRESSLLNYMPNIGRLKKEKIEYYEDGKLDNIIVPLKGELSTWSVIALEFGPRKEAVTWADSIVRSNPSKKYILMTHEWLSRNGERVGQGSYAEKQLSALSYSTPQEIWDRMVYPNDNIVCVVCGHNGFCQYLFSPNKKGREVCQILFNLQYQQNGGDGMVQLWEFPKRKDEINIFVYNTIKREVHKDITTRVKIKI